MPGADDLMPRIYAAMAQKERELISARTRAALAAAKARARPSGATAATGQPPVRTPPRRHGCGGKMRNALHIGAGWNCTACAKPACRGTRPWPEPSTTAACRRPVVVASGRTLRFRASSRAQRLPERLAGIHAGLSCRQIVAAPTMRHGIPLDRLRQIAQPWRPFIRRRPAQHGHDGALSRGRACRRQTDRASKAKVS
ncbi:hypothetical protein [Roseomonas rosulenta]|uniref:hypothetical protein n=1 Tax=Roseomonas rosulenta TaxID=2748667 RepID=UPI0034E1955A